MLGLLAPFLGSMARHALSLVAGYLVAAGLLPEAQVNGFVAACLLFAGLGWALWQKINQPGTLAALQARAAQKNIDAKISVARSFEASPNVLAALGVAAALAFVSIAPAPAAAQGFSLFSSPAQKVLQKRVKKKAPSKSPLPGRMDAGLVSLITGQPSLADQMWAKLQEASIHDLEFAKALADGVKDSPAAAQRSKCYSAWLGMLASLSSASAAINGAAGDHKPGPSLFTKFEQLAQVADNLAPLSSFQIACTPVAAAMKMRLGEFVLSVVGGGLSLGKLGVLP